jgi:hypothetical protein
MLTIAGGVTAAEARTLLFGMDSSRNGCIAQLSGRHVAQHQVRVHRALDMQALQA